MVKAEPRRIRGENNAPHSVSWNVWGAFFGCAIDLSGNILAVPVQLLGCVGFIENSDGNMLPFPEPQQGPENCPL